MNRGWFVLLLIVPTIVSAYDGSSSYKMGAFVSYNNAWEIKYNGTTTIGGNSTSFDGSAISEQAPGLGFSFEFRPHHRAGVEIGYEHAFEREISYDTINAGGTSSTTYYDSSRPTFTIDTFILNSKLYITDEVYLFGGINRPQITIKNIKSNIKPKIGYQVGMGTKFAKNFAFELQYRSTNASGSSDVSINNTSYHVTYDNFGMAATSSALIYYF